MAVIAVDLDGTLVFGATPIEGAKDAINLWRECGHKVIIHSCNNPKWIEKVLRDADIRYDYLWDDQGKPVADLYVDDKGFHFQGNWAEDRDNVLARLTGLDNRKSYFLEARQAGEMKSSWNCPKCGTWVKEEMRVMCHQCRSNAQADHDKTTELPKPSSTPPPDSSA